MNTREYHIVGERVSELPYAEFSRPLWGDAARRFAELGPIGQAIAEKLMDQAKEDSIERITFRPDSVRVYRAPSVSWGPLEWHTVIPAIKEALGGHNASVMQYEDFNKLQQLVHT